MRANLPQQAWIIFSTSLLMLFLDPNLEIGASNFQNLVRFFKGGITVNWKNRWKLEEPALLVEFPGDPPSWKLVKMGRLKADI